jgi:hypothetical protein
VRRDLGGGRGVRHPRGGCGGRRVRGTVRRWTASRDGQRWRRRSSTRRARRARRRRPSAVALEEMPARWCRGEEDGRVEPWRACGEGGPTCRCQIVYCERTCAVPWM